MTIKQEVKRKMYLSVDEFLVKNSELTKSLPEFETTLAEFRDVTGKIDLFNEQQDNVRTGVSKVKKDTKNSLIAVSTENAGKVFAFARVSKDKALMDEVDFSISDVSRMTDISLKTFTETLYKKIESLLDKLSGYGITAETQKQFSETIKAYIDSLAKPRLGIAEKRETTLELKKLFDSADEILFKLDALLKIIEYREVKFYEGYKTVRKLVNTNAGNVALLAEAIDLMTKESLKGVLFTFKSNETFLKKKTAKKGSFYIKNLKPGSYDVLVKKEGYKEQTLKVNVSDGERKDLSIELEKV
jgi:secreted Zn-dependent insulinase-like peptidase